MRLVMLLGVLGLAAAIACSGGDGDDSSEATGTSEAGATEVGTPSGVTPEAGSPAGAATIVAATKYVGATGGGGVSIRDDCRDDARVGGSWPDGAAVVVLQTGSDDCAEWSYVAGAGGASWVRDKYLVDTRISAPAASGGGSSGGGSSSGGASSTPKPTSTTLPAPQLPPFEIVTPDGTLLTSKDLDGKAVLRGGETGFTYLGLVSSSRSIADSICNRSGAYGSTGSALSVHNDEGAYGKLAGGSIYEPFFNSDFSAYNSGAIKPPKVMLGDDLVGWLTTNSEQFEANAIDPNVLFAYYGCLY